MTERYHINVMWSAEDEAWIADVPDLPGCSSHGDTPGAALANVEEAMVGWLAVAQDRGLAIPAARYRPAIYAGRYAA